MLAIGDTNIAQLAAGWSRLRSRGRPQPLLIDLLERFGSSMACGRGAERLFFDKAARKRLKQHFGGDRGLKVVERWLRTYVVVGNDGRIVTVAQQCRRFRRA
jgi:hypothetical protein